MRYETNKLKHCAQNNKSKEIKRYLTIWNLSKVYEIIITKEGKYKQPKTKQIKNKKNKNATNWSPSTLPDQNKLQPLFSLGELTNLAFVSWVQVWRLFKESCSMIKLIGNLVSVKHPGSWRFYCFLCLPETWRSKLVARLIQLPAAAGSPAFLHPQTS